MPEDKDEEVLPELSIYKSTEWVQWKAEKCEIPDWWAELSTVPEENTGKTSPRGESFIPAPKVHA